MELSATGLCWELMPVLQKLLFLASSILSSLTLNSLSCSQITCTKVYLSILLMWNTQFSQRIEWNISPPLPTKGQEISD